MSSLGPKLSSLSIGAITWVPPLLVRREGLGAHVRRRLSSQEKSEIRAYKNFAVLVGW